MGLDEVYDEFEDDMPSPTLIPIPKRSHRSRNQIDLRTSETLPPETRYRRGVRGSDRENMVVMQHDLFDTEVLDSPDSEYGDQVFETWIQHSSGRQQHALSKCSTKNKQKRSRGRIVCKKSIE